jgi:hypothetical protein
VLAIFSRKPTVLIGLTPTKLIVHLLPVQTHCLYTFCTIETYAITTTLHVFRFAFHTGEALGTDAVLTVQFLTTQVFGNVQSIFFHFAEIFHADFAMSAVRTFEGTALFLGEFAVESECTSWTIAFFGKVSEKENKEMGMSSR